MSKVKMPDPFGYFCDWGDSQFGQRIAMYWGEPGNAIDDDWNEHPKAHKNVDLYTAEQMEAFAAARVAEALEAAANAVVLRVRPHNEVSDWTEYARTRADASDQAVSEIRALIPPNTHPA